MSIGARSAFEVNQHIPRPKNEQAQWEMGARQSNEGVCWRRQPSVPQRTGPVTQAPERDVPCGWCRTVQTPPRTVPAVWLPAAAAVVCSSVSGPRHLRWDGLLVIVG